MAVGGRSAVGREKTGSIIMGPNEVARVTYGAPEERSLRSASEDTATRHFSLNMAPSKSLEHRPTLKKKRWSHPDLPAKAEKSHNDKVDAIHAAVARGVQVRSVPVQKPPHPVIEERPTSADSIDLDVDRYLNAPRLSQKIRHPHTGRVISFSEVGDPQGFAVFVCVGMGLTRYVMSFYDQLAQTLKLRLITPDRPGIGGSQLDPNGTPLSWPGEFLYPEHCEQITNEYRRCPHDMPDFEDQQVFAPGTFGRRRLRTCHIPAHASAHSRTSASFSALDPSFPDGAYRYQPRSAAYATAA
jgi:hypothetical protein